MAEVDAVRGVGSKRKCVFCKARCRDERAKFCDQCGHALKRQRKKHKEVRPTSNGVNNQLKHDSEKEAGPLSDSGWFLGNQSLPPLTAKGTKLSEPVRSTQTTTNNQAENSAPHLANSQTTLGIHATIHRTKLRPLQHSHSLCKFRYLPPISKVEKPIIDLLEPKEHQQLPHRDDSDPIGLCSLWGQCLIDAIAEFEATEIILVAEIDSDERCGGVIEQNLQHEKTSQSKYVRHHVSPLQRKHTDLIKKIQINKEKLLRVRQRLRELQQQNITECGLDRQPENDLSASGLVTLNEKSNDEDNSMRILSAIKIQQRFRVMRARCLFADMVRRAYQCVYDPDSKRYFYYNQHTNSSQWEKPRILERVRSERCQRSRKSSQQDLEAAATKIQGLFRRRAARIGLSKMLSQIYEKVYDAESDSYYYYCKRTKLSTWEKPRLLTGADEDAPVIRPAYDLAVDTTQHRAASKIQVLYRTRATRLFLRDLAMGNIERYFDDASQSWYCFNTRTQQTFWERSQDIAITRREQQ